MVSEQGDHGDHGGQGVYLYAVTGDPGEDGRREGLTGILGEPVQVIGHRGLLAHVSRVPLDRFGEEPLRRHLEDLDWVEGVARAHHHVVETLADDVPTAPVRLVTVYHGEAQVRDLLDRRHDDFTAVLSWVAGRREWGVKAYVNPATAASEPGGSSGEPGPGGGSVAGSGSESGGSPGTAYLRRRKASLHSRQDLWRAAAERAERLHAALETVAVAGRRHRPQDPRLSGRTDWMVLNGAYLVDADREEEFAAVPAPFREQGFIVELTGPWAPYSFTDTSIGATTEAPTEASP
ncbi:GvpL/GvpF family gas vesicle protein [Sphaerimonospora cavernae]|uniref:GvpL/GvpF family gas vesicle protein n=1 Tax=Sphaerimonospora cavernae TaxID=1740611 RepID=A0ABV6U042_9ACTN